MKAVVILLVISTICITATRLSAQTQLDLLDQFSTSGGIGLAFDPTTDTVITYGSDTIRIYSRTGQLLGTINNAPGESANDADLEVAGVSLKLGATQVPAGTILFTNGETNQAEIYAISPSGSLLATLNTSFGNSHVVGCAYHHTRGTFFMVQDRVPSNQALDNLVAEVHPETGAVLNSFDLDFITPDFTVNYGDIEICNVTGNLLVVSTDESVILELSPDGIELARWVLAPGSGGSLSGSGIAVDDARNELYVYTTGNTVYRYAILRPTTVAASFVYHGGWSGSGAPQWSAIDASKTVAVPGQSPVELSVSNVTNSQHGINGIVFDIYSPGALDEIDWVCKWSPVGVFDQTLHPIDMWEVASSPSGITKFTGEGVGSSDRILIEWPNNVIANRWLHIQVVIGGFSRTFFIGHLLGETSGDTNGTYTVAFEDIANIRSLVGTTVDAGSIADIDKNGVVSFADISAMRTNVGAQLSNISIP